MKILSQEKLAKSQEKIIIEVSKEEMDGFVRQAGQKLSQSLKIPGFRPGKVPFEMVLKEVGQERILAEALDFALPKTYFEAVTYLKLVPIAKPEIKVLDLKKDYLKYEAKLSLMPQVKIEKWKDFVTKSKIKPQKIKVEESQIKEVLENLKKEFAFHKDIERKAQKGDLVEIDFEAKIGGQTLPGGKSQNHPLIIGSKTFVPGFEEELVGLKKGDKKNFNLTFSPDYHKKELAGKLVDFEVEVKKVKEIILPELSELAQKFGKRKAIELELEVKKSLEEKAKRDSQKKFEEELLNYLISKIDIELPEVLVSEEINYMVENFKHYLSHQGLTLEKYLEGAKKTEEEFKKSFEPEAIKRVKAALILLEIAKSEKIEVSDKDITEEAKIRGLDLRKEKEKDYLRNVLRNKKTMEVIKQVAGNR